MHAEQRVGRAVVVEILLRAVDAVRQLAQPPADRLFGQFDGAVDHRQHRIDAVLLDHLVQALGRDAVGGDHAAEVEAQIGRHPRHAEHQRQHVVADLVILDDLHRRDQHALGKHVGRFRADAGSPTSSWCAQVPIQAIRSPL